MPGLNNRRYLSAAMDAAGLPEPWRKGIYRAADAHEIRGGLVGSGWLVKQCKALHALAGHVPINATSHDVRARADELADEVAEAWRRDWSCDWDARAIVMREGEEWPGIQRATCRNWWRRRIMRSLNERTENAARDLGHVGSHGPAYVSDETLQRYVTAKRLSEQAIDSAFLDEVTDGMAKPVMALREAIDASVSNPTIRLAELITRARGFEAWADERQHVGWFWTLTLGSKWHATRKDGRMNWRWNGSTVRQCADELLASYKRVQDTLRKAGIEWYGIRVMEPHTDGTPHMHLLTWCGPEDVAKLRSTFYRAFLRDEEVLIPLTFATSNRWRVKSMQIDKSRGSAVGYLVKYLTKNMTNGHKLNKPGRGVARVKAWAHAHHIRQFQFAGGPPIQTWRESRRMTRDDAMECEQFALAFDCVHRGDWRGDLAEEGADLLEEKRADFGEFIRIQGGMRIARRDRPIQTLRAADRVNRYGERSERIAGLLCGTAVALTRSRNFVIRWGGHRGVGSGSNLGLVSITSRAHRGDSSGKCRGDESGRLRQGEIWSAFLVGVGQSGHSGTQ